MAASPRSRTPTPVALGPNPSRALCEFLLNEARAALARHGLSAADRDDLAQKTVMTVLRRWYAYRAEAGSLRQWVRGIVRNEVRVFRRQQGVAPPAGDAEQVDPNSEVATPETKAAMGELLDRLLADLPIKQRRIVILVEMCGLTLHEAALEEKTSTTRAHARHKAGMLALRDAAERWRRDQESRGIVVLPFTIATLFAGSRAPAAPPELRDKVWRHVSTTLGLDAPAGVDGAVEGDPPPSGPRLLDPGAAARDGEPPSSRPPRRDPATRRLLRKLGLLGVLLGGVLIHPCQDDLLEVRPALAAASPTTSAAEMVAPAPDAASAPVVTGGSTLEPERAPGSAGAAPRAQAEGGARGRGEEGLLDRGRAALTAHNPVAALDALTDHRRRFSGGLHVTTRERLWTTACALARELATRDDTAVDGRCTGRP
jgi:RNA polymerase sigma factor (sigma-70 family)